jgi:hypothetical protein
VLELTRNCLAGANCAKLPLDTGLPNVQRRASKIVAAKTILPNLGAALPQSLYEA